MSTGGRRFLASMQRSGLSNGAAKIHLDPNQPNLNCMLNTAFWVETNRDKRAFLYVDSVLLSGEF